MIATHLADIKRRYGHDAAKRAEKAAHSLFQGRPELYNAGLVRHILDAAAVYAFDTGKSFNRPQLIEIAERYAFVSACNQVNRPKVIVKERTILRQYRYTNSLNN